jgi:gamma-carbonic anhydrase
MTDRPGTYSFRGQFPRLEPGVFLAPGCAVIGDVEIGENSSVWFGSVVRGDVCHIRIGRCVNVQDLTVIHVTRDRYPTIVHDNVTIGHRAILHGCTVASGALIGMGATVMDDAVVGEGALVAAGALVTPGTKIPAGMLAVGSPAKVKRPLSDEERVWLHESPGRYAELAATYLQEPR